MFSIDLLRPLLIAFTSLLFAGSVGVLAFEILRMVFRKVDLHSENWDYEKNRLLKLHYGSLTYRWFEPLIREIKDSRILDRLIDEKEVDLALRRGGSELPWTARELMGTTFLESILLSAFLGAAAAYNFDITPGCFFGLVAFVVVFRVRINETVQHADQRMIEFRQRLPFAIDLMALMLEAGGDIRECLTTVVKENCDHPVGIEIGRVQHAMQGGTSLLEALTQLQNRLNEESLSEIAFSIRSAEQLGTPLGKTFLDLASQMRLKRSQYAEKLVGEATTMLPMANLITMVAGLLAIVAPYAIKMFMQAPF